MSPQLSPAVAQELAERLEHAISQPGAEYGALLVKGVRMADFLAASEQLEVQIKRGSRKLDDGRSTRSTP